MADVVTITGLAEVQEFLVSAPKLVVANTFLKALQAGADVIAAGVAAVTPERDEGDRSEEDGHLIDGLMTAVDLDSQLRGGVASVGFGKQGRKALWVEFGHRLISHAPKKKYIKFVQPHPFMRPAADASANAAIEAFAESLVESLESSLLP